MDVRIYDTAEQLGQHSASDGSQLIRKAIAQHGQANIIVCTGTSQFQTLASLVADKKTDWSKVTAFHLDEYIGLPFSHPASFRKYLKERFVDHLPLRQFHYISGEDDPQTECRRVGELISRHPIDVTFIGIGENGHLAFNDPPADFETEEPYIVVTLDEVCRRQQFGEGWFPSLNDVPRTAISMSIKQIIKSKSIICSVPDLRKAKAVVAALQGPVTPNVPASILQQHPDAVIYLDRDAASLMDITAKQK